MLFTTKYSYVLLRKRLDVLKFTAGEIHWGPFFIVSKNQQPNTSFELNLASKHRSWCRGAAMTPGYRVRKKIDCLIVWKVNWITMGMPLKKLNRKVRVKLLTTRKNGFCGNGITKKNLMKAWTYVWIYYHRWDNLWEHIVGNNIHVLKGNVIWNTEIIRQE